MPATLLPAVLAILAILAGTSAAACPCSYDTESKEVTCEAGSQTQLPFYLPDCLTPSVDTNQVREASQPARPLNRQFYSYNN